MNASEDQVVQAILVKYKHPLSAVRHLLTFYNDLPASTLERMTYAILKQHPAAANLSRPVDVENRATFIREGQKRKSNATKAVAAAQAPYDPPRPTAHRSRSHSRSKPSKPSTPAPTPEPSKPATPKTSKKGFFATLFD